MTIPTGRATSGDGHCPGGSDDYWQRTGPFWSAVRDYWSGVYAQHRDFRLEDTVAGKPLFMSLFELAEAYADAPKDTLSALSALMARAVIIESE